MIFIMPAISSIATDIAKIVPPIFAISSSLAILVTSTRAATNPTKAKTKAPPFNISSGFNFAASFTIPIMSIIASDILSTIPPTLSIFLPPSSVIAVSARTNTRNAPANAAPFNISAVESIPANLTTPTIRSIAIAIFVSIFPSLSMFCAGLPFTSTPNTVRTAPIAATIPANPRKPRVACLVSSLPTILTA